MTADSKSSAQPNRCILVLGTDPGSLRTLLEPLKWENWDARSATSFKELNEILESWKPQIVLIDESPFGIGAKWLTYLREKLPFISILFISEASDTDSIIAGLDQGADDYIIKPFVPLELLARIRTHVRIRDLHEQLVFANEKLKELVDIDDLTGLYNMRSLYQRLDFELERGRRFGRGVCAIMMDMDRFKSVNDGHDHLFGSYVLSEVGKIIKANTRNIDIPARYGGDEFLIVLTEMTEEGVIFFCERLRRTIEKTTFSSGDDSIRLTISIGYALSAPGEALASKELVRRADHALYESKRTGRNRTTGYRPKEKPAEEIVNVHDLPERDEKVAASAPARNKKKRAG